MDALLKANLNIVAVVTSVDNYSGRAANQYSAIKQYALEKNLPILQPSNMKSQEFINELKAYNADIHIVVAFRMMPEIVWNMPPLGTINLHGSLLPKYRGAAPINWAIINGEKITGVTTFKLKHEIDTGNILLQKSINILPDDTAETIHDSLMLLGANMLVETIKGVFQDIIKETPQDLTKVTNAPKLFKHNTIIDWNNNCQYIHNFVRGLNPYPSAYLMLGKKILKVFKTHIVIDNHKLEVGKLYTDNKTYIRFTCIDGFVYLDEVQLEGKKRMNIKDFLNGNKLSSSYFNSSL